MKFLVSFRRTDPVDRVDDEWHYFREPFDGHWLNFRFTNAAKSPRLSKCDADRVFHWQKGRPEWQVRVEAP